MIVALRKESVDRNTQRRDFKRLGLLSLSARRAWIEIINNNYNDLTRPVALRKESVDRNLSFHNSIKRCLVALRKESVDRNSKIAKKVLTSMVALRKESVDRNNVRHTTTPRPSMSLSARRAWIEMHVRGHSQF